MKSLVCTTPGKLEYRSKDRPSLTTGNAILRIRRIGICGTDLHAFEGTQPYFNYPRILGHELSAELLESDGAPGFVAGEKVTIIPYFNCGKCIACLNSKPNCCVSLNVCGVHSDGGMVEFLSVPSSSLLHGAGLSDDALGLIEPLAIGAHGVKRANVKPGEFVLVVGAGPIGLGTMEFSKIAGGIVIALDVNENRLRFCKENLKADYFIHADTFGVSDQLKKITNGNMPAVVIDATGNLKAINTAFRFMAHGGRYVLIGLQKGDITFSHPEFHKREGTLMSSRNATREDFEQVISSIKNGSVDPTSYITHRVAFDRVREEFSHWLDPESNVIKAMVEF